MRFVISTNIVDKNKLVNWRFNISSNDKKVRVSGAQGAIFNLYNIMGSKIIQQRIHSDDELINLSMVSPGLYIISIQSGNNSIYTSKIIIER